MKIGRNAPCPCGSGKKFKKCHGTIQDYNNHNNVVLSKQDIKRIGEQLFAEEKQREKQQGLGRPIISLKHNGYRFVAVGEKFYYSKKWETFHDFLLEYIKIVLEGDWGNKELKKPYEQQHLILQWYRHVCDYQNGFIKVQGQIQSAPMSGAVAAYLNLAYNLYLLGHNVKLQKLLISRLMDKNNFWGAYYETFVAAAFIKAGFKIELENESDPTSSHCEFTAIDPKSGEKYSVEAKCRLPGKENKDISMQLKRALSKKAEHIRVVFIEMNVEDTGDNDFEVYSRDVVSKIRNCQQMQINGEDAPPAYVIITNSPYHYELDSTKYRWSVVGEGFKINDFKNDYMYTSIREGIEIEKKHSGVFQLMDAIKSFNKIPATFDGQIPQFSLDHANESRLIIGEKYMVPVNDSECDCVLQDACVNEKEKLIYCAFNKPDGKGFISSVPMTDNELEAYREYPDTFFGVYKEANKKLADPIELYEWLKNNYKDTPKEKLIEFMQAHESIDKLNEMSQEELSDLYCEGLATSMWNNRIKN